MLVYFKMDILGLHMPPLGEELDSEDEVSVVALEVMDLAVASVPC
jgi:hypothetical protein